MLATATFFALLSIQSFALLTSEVGNKDLAAANYTDWPGLVNAINDQSRVQMVWCNGNEHFAYSGETSDLNRVLKNFAATDVPKLKVVLRPASGESVKVDGMQRAVGWRINIVGGIARAAITEWKLDSVWQVAPTLTVYVSDLVDLKELEIPQVDKLEVLQLADLRKHYETAKGSVSRWALKREISESGFQLDIQPSISARRRSVSARMRARSSSVNPSPATRIS